MRLIALAQRGWLICLLSGKRQLSRKMDRKPTLVETMEKTRFAGAIKPMIF
jgi:hypothetical protein